MQFETQRSFEFESKKYDIRVASDNVGYKVVVFHDNKRVNPYTYSVDFNTDFNFSATQGIHAYSHLMDVAESDVRAKCWERYLEAIKASNG